MSLKYDGLNNKIDSVSGSLSFGVDNATSINIGGNQTTLINISQGVNPTVINIGSAGDTVNINGTVEYINTQDLLVVDKTITLNISGALGSSNSSGIYVQEMSADAGWLRIDNNRNSWGLKVPGVSGQIYLTPSNTNGVYTEIHSNATSNRSIDLQDGSGVLAFLSDVQNSTGSITNYTLKTETQNVTSSLQNQINSHGSRHFVNGADPVSNVLTTPHSISGGYCDTSYYSPGTSLFAPGAGDINSWPISSYGAGTIITHKVTDCRIAQFAIDKGAGQFWFRGTVGTCYNWNPWYRVWHSGYMGHATGLDADKLDGNEGSYYIPVSTTAYLTGSISNNINARLNPGYIQPYNSHAGNFNTTYISDLHNIWHNATNYYSIAIAGSADSYSLPQLFAGDYETAGLYVSPSGSATVSISSNIGSHVYTSGYVYVTSYWGRHPESVRVRQYNVNTGTWSAWVTGGLYHGDGENQALWKVNIPEVNYVTIWEVDIKAKPSYQSWVTKIEYMSIRATANQIRECKVNADKLDNLHGSYYTGITFNASANSLDWSKSYTNKLRTDTESASAYLLNGITSIRSDYAAAGRSTLHELYSPGGIYGSVAGFDQDPPVYGESYVTGVSASPHTGSQGGYRWRWALGSNYPTAKNATNGFGLEWNMTRTPYGGNGVGYLFYRQMESGTWGNWDKLKAGYSDWTSNAATLSGQPLSYFTPISTTAYLTGSYSTDLVHKTGNETLTGTKTFTQPRINSYQPVTSTAVYSNENLGQAMFGINTTPAVAGITGAIVLTAPNGFTDTMMQGEIEINAYNGGMKGKVQFAGYNYSGGPSWVSHYGIISGLVNIGYNFPVRFGYNASIGKCVIVLGSGATNYVWTGFGMGVNLNKLMTYYNNQHLWGSSWNIALSGDTDLNSKITFSGGDVGTVSWNGMNDGNGSGLDADLLEGQHGGYYNTVSFNASANALQAANAYTNGTAVLRSASSPTWNLSGGSEAYTTTIMGADGGPNWVTNYHGMHFGHGFGYGSQLAMRNGVFKFRSYNASVYSPWYDVWTSASDGHGTGLDADLLDGQEGSYYTTISSNASANALAWARDYTNRVLDVTGNYVKKSGDTMTGALTVYNNVNISDGKLQVTQNVNSQANCIDLINNGISGSTLMTNIRFYSYNGSTIAYNAWFGHTGTSWNYYPNAYPSAAMTFGCVTSGGIALTSEYPNSSINFSFGNIVSPKIIKFNQSNFYAEEDNQYTLGTSSKKWANIYTNRIESDGFMSTLNKSNNTGINVPFGYLSTKNEWINNDNQSNAANNYIRIGRISFGESWAFGTGFEITISDNYYTAYRNAATYVISRDGSFWVKNYIGRSPELRLVRNPDIVGVGAGLIPNYDLISYFPAYTGRYIKVEGIHGLTTNILSMSASIPGLEIATPGAPIYFTSSNWISAQPATFAGSIIQNYNNVSIGSISGNGTIALNAPITSPITANSIYPLTSSVYDLGKQNDYWNTLYANRRVSAISPSDTRIYENLISSRAASVPVTGAIKLTLPQSWTNTFMMGKLSIMTYAGTIIKGEIDFYGYNFTGGYWADYISFISGLLSTSKPTVRFGHDGSKCCIVIGTDTTNWGSYDVTVSLDKLTCSNASSETLWLSGYSISYLNSTQLGTITFAGADSGYAYWNQLNDGTGSGLDADLLEGQHGSYYTTISSNASANALSLSKDFTNLLRADTQYVTGFLQAQITSGTAPATILTRTIPTTVGSGVMIGSYYISSGAHSLKIILNVSSGGFSQSKTYIINTQYGLDSNWLRMLPIMSTGAYSGQDCDLEIFRELEKISLRIVRTAGTTAGTATIAIENRIAADTFTADTSSGNTLGYSGVYNTYTNTTVGTFGAYGGATINGASTFGSTLTTYDKITVRADQTGANSIVISAGTLTNSTKVGRKDSRVIFNCNSTTVSAGGEIIWSANSYNTDRDSDKWAALTGDIVSNTPDGAEGNIWIANKLSLNSDELIRRFGVLYDGNVAINHHIRFNGASNQIYNEATRVTTDSAVAGIIMYNSGHQYYGVPSTADYRWYLGNVVKLNLASGGLTYKGQDNVNRLAITDTQFRVISPSNVYATGNSAFEVNGAYLTIGDSISATVFPQDAIGIKFHDSGIKHGSLVYYPSTSQFKFANSNASVALLPITVNTAAITIDTNYGNVGIFQENPRPTHKLDISGNVIISGGRLDVTQFGISGSSHWLMKQWSINPTFAALHNTVLGEETSYNYTLLSDLNGNTYLNGVNNAYLRIGNADKISFTSSYIYNNVSVYNAQNHNVSGGLFTDNTATFYGKGTNLPIRIARGDDSTNDVYAQIALDYYQMGYSHYISTRHNAADTLNSIKFWLNTSATANGSTSPGVGNKLGLDISSKVVMTPLNLAISGSFVTNLSGDGTAIFDCQDSQQYSEISWAFSGAKKFGIYASNNQYNSPRWTDITEGRYWSLWSYQKFGTGADVLTVDVSGNVVIPYGNLSILTLNPATSGNALTWDQNGKIVDSGYKSGRGVTTTISLSAYAVTTNDTVILVDTSSLGVSNQSTQLYTAIGNANRTLIVKKIDTTSKTVTISAFGSQLIDGSNTYILYDKYSGAEIMSDGTKWHVINTV